MDPNAVSPVGAEGLAQIMPATWAEISRKLGWGKAISPRLAGPAIEAGAYYQGELRRRWRAVGRTSAQRNALGEASYNSGMGNILKAQKACHDAPLWPDIAPCLSQITGPLSHETLTYVERIARYQAIKEAMR